MEQSQAQNFWVVWYPSYMREEFKLIVNQPIIANITDDYHSKEQTYLKIEPEHPEKQEPEHPEKQEPTNIRLSFYNKDSKKKGFFRRFREKFSDNIQEKIPDGSKLIATVDLKYKNHSSDGLFVYECSANDNSKQFKHTEPSLFNTEKSLSNDHKQYATFYFVKELYHTHLFHKKSKQDRQYRDYFYRAYIADKEINVKKKNNEAIKFYLQKTQKHYQEQLEHFEKIKTYTNADIKTKIKWIKKSIEELQSRINDNTTEIEKMPKDNPHDLKTIKRKEELNELWEKIIIERNEQRDIYIEIGIKKKDRNNLYKTANDIVGETLFTNVLCCSEYLDKRNSEVRALVLNIENLKTGLYYIRDWYKHEKDKRASTLGIVIGMFGFAVGIFSVLFTLAGSYLSQQQQEKIEEFSQDQQEKIEKLFQKRDSLLVNTIKHSLEKDTVYIEISPQPAKK